MTNLKSLCATLFGILNCGSAFAFPSEELIFIAIDASPTMRAALAERDASFALSEQLAAGPYEVDVYGAIGRRSAVIDPGFDEEYTEWSGGVSRAVRLPGKRRIDQNIARLERERAELKVGLARQRALLDFIDRWSEWRRADAKAQLSFRLAAEARELADASDAGFEMGATRKVAAQQWSAHAAMLDVEAQTLTLDAQAAKARLQQLVPSLILPDHPDPFEIDPGEIERITRADPPVFLQVSLAQVEVDIASQRAIRSTRDRLPDPTVGFEVSNEFGGDETSAMITFSVPLGGRHRREAATAAENTALRDRATQADFIRAFENEVAASRARALAASSLMAVSQEGRSAARDVRSRLREGFQMKAIDLGELIESNRTLVALENSLLDQQLAFERSVLRLLVLTGASIDESRLGP